MKIMNRSGDPLAEHEVLASLEAEGMAFLADADCREVVEAFRGVLTAYRHPDSPSAPWTVIQPEPGHRDNPGSGGFTHGALKLHTDRSMLAAPPAILCFIMVREATDGGDSILLDTKPLLTRYGLKSLRRIEDDLLLFSRLQGWSRRVLTIQDSGNVIIRYRDDDVARPTARSRLARSLLCDLQEAREDALFFRSRPGQGYVIHNHRILHGRTSFTGPRKGARILFRVGEDSPCGTLNNGFIIDRGDGKRESNR